MCGKTKPNKCYCVKQQQQQHEHNGQTDGWMVKNVYLDIVSLPQYPLMLYQQCYQRAKRIYLLLQQITKVGSGRECVRAQRTVCGFFL